MVESSCFGDVRVKQFCKIISYVITLVTFEDWVEVWVGMCSSKVLLEGTRSQPHIATRNITLKSHVLICLMIVTYYPRKGTV